MHLKDWGKLIFEFRFSSSFWLTIMEKIRAGEKNISTAISSVLEREKKTHDKSVYFS